MYEWNYPRQILEIRLLEAEGASREEARKNIFSEEFLLKRPLLQAIENHADRAPVLLIDELDCANEEFESFLLELLSDWQITIPELGTLHAKQPPVVVVTSNRTREIHDAIKRRCVCHWIDFPTFEKELEIVWTKVPGMPERLSQQIVAFVQSLRQQDVQTPRHCRNDRLGANPDGNAPRCTGRAGDQGHAGCVAQVSG